MTQTTPPPIPALIPDTAPFSAEQRTWLNGFFAGLLSLDGGVNALSPAETAALMSDVIGGGADSRPRAGRSTTATTGRRPGTTRRCRLTTAWSSPRAGRCGGG